MTHSAGRIGNLKQQLSEKHCFQSDHCSQFITAFSISATGERKRKENKKMVSRSSIRGFIAGFPPTLFSQGHSRGFIESKGVLFCEHPQTGWEFHNARRHKHNLCDYCTFLRKTKPIYFFFSYKTKIPAGTKPAAPHARHARLCSVLDADLFSFSRRARVHCSCSLFWCSRWASSMCCPQGESWSRARLE